MWIVPLLACVAPDASTARAAWLQEQLTADNAYWLTRSPTLVEEKYARMAADPYDWMRGGNTLFLADLVRPDPDRARSGFLSTPDAGSVLLIGDAHLENLGTCLPGDEPDPADVDAAAALTLEWVDLDAAAFGPWTLDTRRTALALALVADTVEACEDCVGPVVVAFATAYADELATQAAGRPGWDAAAEGVGEGALVAALRRSAREDGRSGDTLDKYTVVTPEAHSTGDPAGDTSTRRLALDAARGDDGKGLLALDAADAARLAAVLDDWQDGRPDGLRVLEAARLYGKGVASLPATRFLVLWDRGGRTVDDDRLLNVREVLDPPSIDGLLPGLGSIYVDNADRIGAVPRQLWSRPDADIRTGGVADGAAAFKSSSSSGWFATFEHADIAEAFADEEATAADLEALAHVVGRALASTHARGTTLDGAPAAPVIAADLRAGGGAPALVEERVRDAHADLEGLYADHALFREMLEQLGPLIGAERLYP